MIANILHHRGGRQRLIDHLRLLSDSDRVRRFGCEMTDQQLVQWVAGLVASRDAALCVLSHHDGRIRAAMVLQPYLRNSRAESEASLTVAPDARRQGLGMRLAAAALDWAQGQSIRNLRFAVDSTNFPMLAMARKLGAEVGLAGGWSLSVPVAVELSETQRMVGRFGSIMTTNNAGAVAVALHGAGGSAWQFRCCAPILASRGMQLLAIDVPLARVSGSTISESLCAELAGALESDAVRPALVLGHSLGAVLATRLADRVGCGLALINPMPLDGLARNEVHSASAALRCDLAATELRRHGEYDPVPLRRRSVRILAGRHDRVAPIAFARRSAARCAMRDDAIVLVDAGHVAIPHLGTLLSGDFPASALV